MKGLLLFAACIAVALAVDVITDNEFKLWMSKNEKHYDTIEEAQFRYGVWKKNKEFVETHNAKNLGFTGLCASKLVRVTEC